MRVRYKPIMGTLYATNTPDLRWIPGLEVLNADAQFESWPKHPVCLNGFRMIVTGTFTFPGPNFTDAD